MSTIIYLLITMAFSAFFSGMEIAFVSVDKLRFEMERKPGITSSILSCFFRNPYGTDYRGESAGGYD